MEKKLKILINQSFKRIQRTPEIKKLKGLKETQQWPQVWKRPVFIPVRKKGNAKECSNYHTIALISHASKAMFKVLQARLQQYVNHELPAAQVGFRKGYYTDVCRVWLFILILHHRDVYGPCAVSPSHFFQQGHLPHTGPPITHILSRGPGKHRKPMPFDSPLGVLPVSRPQCPQGLALSLALRVRVFQQTLIPCI